MIARRRFLAGAASVAALVACSRNEKPSAGRAATPANGAAPVPGSVAPVAAGSNAAKPLAAAPSSVKLVEWDFPAGGASTRAVVVIPTWGDAAARYPVVIALHGRGEALKAPADGAMGWPRDYALTRAFDRLRAPPLTNDDYEGLADPSRMAQLNADLAAAPFGGVIVACPHVPDMDPNGGDLGAVRRFLLQTLLPRVHAETPALAAPESTGIDGVSMGGALALRIGLGAPEAFGAVGCLQPAIAIEMAEELTEMARGARARRPRLALRLLTSYGDYFHDAVEATDQAWTDARIAHDYADVPGPHDYIFNRGPGSIELLSWHDKVLARG